MKREAKEAAEEDERARARAAEQDTLKDMQKKQHDAEVQRQRDHDKYLDNMDLMAQHRKVKEEQ